jgi:hypothetical protein
MSVAMAVNGTSRFGQHNNGQLPYGLVLYLPFTIFDCSLIMTIDDGKLYATSSGDYMYIQCCAERQNGRLLGADAVGDFGECMDLCMKDKTGQCRRFVSFASTFQVSRMNRLRKEIVSRILRGRQVAKTARTASCGLTVDSHQTRPSLRSAITPTTSRPPTSISRMTRLSFARLNALVQTTKCLHRTTATYVCTSPSYTWGYSHELTIKVLPDDLRQASRNPRRLTVR